MTVSYRGSIILSVILAIQVLGRKRTTNDEDDDEDEDEDEINSNSDGR